jgi:cyclopropane fatty-acyl-phospholipid synthase-like methyltransferase
VSLHANWDYREGDPMLVLFDHAVKRWGFDLQPGAKVLELGCRETDWAQRLKKALDCRLIGVDALPCPDYGGDVCINGDASDTRLFDHPELQPGTFDAVISLGAVEHFGLGYYGDPVGEHKDTQAIANAWSWLKPGGSLYFDVPWTPADAHQTNHYRVYSDQTLRERFTSSFVWRARGWAPNTLERDGFTEVRPMAVYQPFYFIAQWGVKPT